MDPGGVSTLLFESVRELLFNVLKHAGVRQARVSVSLADDGLIKITVADEGAGFDIAGLQARGAQAGFGLFSIRERIDLLGGQVQIEAAPGSGARVTLVVPVPAPAVREEPGQAERGGTGVVAEGPGVVRPEETAAIRVLVADDHEIMREGLAKLIQVEADIAVVGEAADGAQAVEMARELHPQVVVMDMSMPRMNGLEATQRILAEMPDIRVIGLSMYEKADREEAMRKAGAVAYLTKDGPSADLIAAIRAAAGSRR
jgi:CheY-like chemotaxis protein